MNYTLISACDELKEFVSHFWVGTWDVQSQESNSMYYVVASSLTEIIFGFKYNGQQPELLFSFVQGQTSNPEQYPVEGFFELFGVALYSYAIPYLFNIPASELNSEFISLNTLLGNEGDRLAEKIVLVNTSQERINILTEYLKSLLSKQTTEDKLITKAIQNIRQCNGSKKVISLSHDSCLSHRQFERRFKEFSGFNPKMFARIIRFETFLRNYTNYPTLTQAAYGNGYYDQSHFIREFRAFTGFSPNNFFKLSEDNI